MCFDMCCGCPVDICLMERLLWFVEVECKFGLTIGMMIVCVFVWIIHCIMPVEFYSIFAPKTLLEVFIIINLIIIIFQLLSVFWLNVFCKLSLLISTSFDPSTKCLFKSKGHTALWLEHISYAFTKQKRSKLYHLYIIKWFHKLFKRTVHFLWRKDRFTAQKTTSAYQGILH